MNEDLGRIGRYSLLRPLGEGGMAEVFLASTEGLEDFRQYYALKRIHRRLTDDTKFVRMFLDEARITVALQHPNIVDVHDLGEEDGRYFIAMEFVDGLDLRRVISGCTQLGASFPYRHALFVVTEALKALAYAHEARDDQGQPLNVVHRDVSPSNILISRNGAVKLTDFGVSRAAIAHWDSNPGELLGKYRYFAPELIQGVPSSRQSDLFALGAVLYELVTGEMLLRGVDYDEVCRELRLFTVDEALERDLSIPTPLEPILARSLAPAPEDRYPSATEFLGDLLDHVYEDRIRISSHELSGFFGQLDDALAPTGELVSGDGGEGASISLLPLREPGSGPSEISLGEQLSETELLEWAFPRGAGASAYLPGQGLVSCDGRTLRGWVADGRVGVDTLVRFDADHWRPLGEFLRAPRPPEPPPGWVRVGFDTLDLRSRLLQVTAGHAGAVVTLWTDESLVALHLRAGAVVGTEAEARVELIEQLVAAELLSPTQALVVGHLARGDVRRTREVLIARGLVAADRLDALIAGQLPGLLARVLGWGNATLVAGPSLELLENVPPLDLDELFVRSIREHVPDAALTAAFSERMDRPLRRGDGEGPVPPWTAAEQAVLDAATGGATLREAVRATASFPAATVLRAALILAQFQRIRFEP